MKKSTALCAAALAAVVFLAGCSARTPVAGKEFQQKAKALGYQVSAVDAGTSGGAKTYRAVKDDGDTEAVFYECSDGSAAQERYALLKKGISSAGDGDAVDSSAYNKYVAQNGEIYYTVVRMDSTVLSCKGIVADKKPVDDLVSSLKY